METRLLAFERASTLGTIATWANALQGKEMPHEPEYLVTNIKHFQFTSAQQGYDALLLLEVTKKLDEPELALSAADVAVIEELTSSIDEPS